jgi:hypothetical protein
MNDRQRTVVVIGSGFALAVVAWTVNRLLADPVGGWTAYAPTTGATFPPANPNSDTWIWREAAVWLAAVAIWSGLALWLRRTRPTPSADA